ncbi:MAG: Lrp/AsnC family transcriptional regulator [Candidatus Margulisbacteria bacterium]|nr:Lrp/AsnC family transcriptional regulator [Candidatus Margulisiibacteriota bacterium]
MNKLEQEILALLKTNARIASSDIARLVKSDEKAVNKIISKLEKSGIIVKYATIINDEKTPEFKDTVRALIEVQVQPQKNTGFDAIAKRICNYDNVVDHYLISGRYDFLIIVEGSSLQDISQFVSEKLAPIDHVKSTTTHFMMKKYKQDGMIFENTSELSRLAVSA